MMSAHGKDLFAMYIGNKHDHFWGKISKNETVQEIASSTEGCASRAPFASRFLHVSYFFPKLVLIVADSSIQPTINLSSRTAVHSERTQGGAIRTQFLRKLAPKQQQERNLARCTRLDLQQWRAKRAILLLMRRLWSSGGYSMELLNPMHDHD